MIWTIELEFHGPREARALAEDDPRIARLAEELDERCSGVLSFNPAEPRLGTTLSIEANQSWEAIAEGLGVFRDLLQKVGFSSVALWECVMARALTPEEQERENQQPLYDLVGLTDIADLLGVSKQRAHQIVNSSLGFPRPIAHLSSGPIWHRWAVLQFAEAWERKPGRPRRRDEPMIPASGPGYSGTGTDVPPGAEDIPTNVTVKDGSAYGRGGRRSAKARLRDPRHAKG